jgi:predicted kinase
MENKTIYIMVGIAGAGKSTWVKNNVNEDHVYINADSIRKELYGNENEQGNPRQVFEIVFDRFEFAITDPRVKTVVVDNTSVNYKTRKEYYKEINDHNIDCKIKLVVFTNHALAKERNQKRDRVVPEFVLDRMIGKFQMPTQEERQIKNLEVIEIRK